MKINHLFEARGEYFKRSADDYVVALASTNSSNPPFVFVIALDRVSIKDSANLLVLKINTAKFKPLLGAKYSTFGQSIVQENLWNNLYRYIYNPRYLDSYENEDVFYDFTYELKTNKSYLEKEQICKFYYAKNVNELSRILVGNLKIPPHLIIDITGVEFAQAAKADLHVGDTEVMYPDNMRKSRLSEIMKLIGEANKRVISHGLGVITKGKMIIAPITSVKTIGLYYHSTRSITIDPAAKVSSEALNTILHEYGHKWFYEHLSKDQHAQIKAKFSEVYSPAAKKELSKDQMDFAITRGKAIQDALKTLKVGDILTYNGRKNKFKQMQPFTIEVVTPAEMKVSYNGNYGKAHLKGSPVAFFDNGFVKNGKLLSTGVEAPATATEKVIDQSWFPTLYSRKNYEEWFAEIFAAYLEDKLTYQPVVDFLKQYLTK